MYSRTVLCNVLHCKCTIWFDKGGLVNWRRGPDAFDLMVPHLIFSVTVSRLLEVRQHYP